MTSHGKERYEEMKCVLRKLKKQRMHMGETRSTGNDRGRMKDHCHISNSDLKALLAAWIADGAVVLPEPRKPPTKLEEGKPEFCIYHRTMRHLTRACWAFLTLFHKMVRNKDLEITSKDVLKDPLLRHKEGRNVMMISHYEEQENPVCAINISMKNLCAKFEDVRVKTLSKTPRFKKFFNQLGLTEDTRMKAIKAVVQIMEENREECMETNGSIGRLFKDNYLALSFSDGDKQV